MRPILFRGKRIDNGEWVYGSFVTHEGIIVTPDGGYDRFEIVPESVGQWTGRTDLKDVKVFDGDLVKDQTEIVGEVKWSEARNGWAVIAEDGWFPFDGDGNFKLMRTEVVGNIYDKTL